MLKEQEVSTPWILKKQEVNPRWREETPPSHVEAEADNAAQPGRVVIRIRPEKTREIYTDREDDIRWIKVDD